MKNLRNAKLEKCDKAFYDMAMKHYSKRTMLGSLKFLFQYFRNVKLTSKLMQGASNGSC